MKLPKIDQVSCKCLHSAAAVDKQSPSLYFIGHLLPSAVLGLQHERIGIEVLGKGYLYDEFGGR